MCLFISICFAFAYAALKPLSDGLFDTSIWVAKTLTPSDIKDTTSAKQFIKFGQAALMDGWISNIPFATTILYLASVVTAFIYSWWFGILMVIISSALGVLCKLILGRAVSHYLLLIYHKMTNRAADYKSKNDTERLQAAESYCEELEKILRLYQGAGVRPPNAKQLKDIPYGDLNYWLKHHTGSAIN